MAEINYKELQDTAKLLNEACGTAIKIIGGKKDDIVEAIKEAVGNGLDGIPAMVLDYHDKFLAEPTKDLPKQDKPDGAEKTKLGNTLEVLREHAEVLGIDVVDGLSIKGLEDVIFETLDSLTNDEWAALPESTQNWDSEMGKLVKEKNKAPVKVKTKKKEDGAEAEEEVKTKPKSKKKVHGPRPDFTFTEGTNAHQIITIFNKLFEQSKGEGLKIKDVQDACEAADVKSNSVRSRVSSVIKYARLPEGGEQVVKHDGLLYPKGAELPE